MMVKAHVSPGLRAKPKPQIEQHSSWDHPENSRPSPQCGQRLRSPRRSAVLINFEREGLIHNARTGQSLERSGRNYFDGGFANLPASTTGLFSTLSMYVVVLSAGLTPIVRTTYGI